MQVILTATVSEWCNNKRTNHSSKIYLNDVKRGALTHYEIETKLSDNNKHHNKTATALVFWYCLVIQIENRV